MGHSSFVLLVKFQLVYRYFINRKMAEETGILALPEEMLVRIAKYLGMDGLTLVRRNR